MITNPKKSLRTRPKSHSIKTVKTSNFLKPFVSGKLILQKSTSYGTSGRSAKGKMTVLRSAFYQNFFKQFTFTIKTDFYLVCLISTPVLHENTLFHLEPSEFYFMRIYYYHYYYRPISSYITSFPKSLITLNYVACTFNYVELC